VGRPARAGETRCVSCFRPENSTVTASMAGAIAPATAPRCPLPAGGQSPRPAPAPPPAGASRPPGRALASAVPGPAGLQGTVPHGRGKRGAFPVPARVADAVSPLQWQGPSPLPRRNVACRQPGAKAPARCPTRPSRPARPRRVGRWPALFPDLPVCRAPSHTGGGNAVRFLAPPGLAALLQQDMEELPPGRQPDFFQHPVSAPSAKDMR
jgi:hypothetical protein